MNRRVARTPENGSANVEPAAVAARPVTPRLRTSAWLEQHLYSALSSLGRLWQRRGATTLTVAVMALALALPLLLHVAVSNLEQFGGALTDSREISVFLRPELTAPATQALADQAHVLADVATVAVRSPQRGLDELRQLAGFADALDLLTENPLPSVLVVTPTGTADDAAITALADTLERLDGADFVQYDLTWRTRLNRALALAARLVAVIGGALALGALLVVGNTIRLDVAGRADEIAIVQLLGGTNGFVRRPFLYAGVWYGLSAALLALIGVAVAQIALSQPVAELAASYGSAFRLHGLEWTAVAATVGAGIVLGWLGAWAACGRHLALGNAT